MTVTSTSIFETFFSRLFKSFHNNPTYMKNFFPIRGANPQTINHVDILINNTIPKLELEGASYEEIKQKILYELREEIAEFPK